MNSLLKAAFEQSRQQRDIDLVLPALCNHLVLQ